MININSHRIAALGAVVVCAASAALAQTPMSTAFTYQGYLTDSGAAADGAYDFEFTLYDAVAAGNLIGGPVYGNDLVVSDGLFTATIDFGANPFDGKDLWLEIGVRPGASGGAYTTLSPRQPLTPGPYSILARGIQLPYAGTVASNVAAFKVTQVGLRESGVFEINNPANAMTALTGFSNGVGLAFQAWNTSGAGGGGVAMIDIPNAANNSDVLQSLTVGGGRAGFFEINNPASPNSALYAKTNSPAGRAFTADNTAGGLAIQANGGINTTGRIVSTLAPGTSPFSVASTTLNTNLNADLLDGYHCGNGAGQIACNNGTLNTSLNADMLEGYHAGNAAGQIALSNSTKCTNLNADLLDGYTAGVSSGMIPVSMGATCINLNADMLDNAHLADLDARYVGAGELNSITTAMLQDDVVTVNELGHNINATGIGFNAAQVNNATISMGTWFATSTSAFITLHGSVTVSGTGSHNERLRFTNNQTAGNEVRVTLVASADASSSVTTVAGGGTVVDITYPHYQPFQVIISDAGSWSAWTTVLWICENDGGGSYLAINHAQ
ncbi:MAG: hypothetical protein CHACPFDD_02822 [Phycisphaerae bacterium]|nr:hypothetical protein [Phycisphaerae bacterium]